MQGRKEFTPQLFYELSLERLVPPDNFYRRVNQALDLHFLYKSTQKYYGTQGQESIDPVVFFKILLVGYLNNINSDRALIRFRLKKLINVPKTGSTVALRRFTNLR